MVCPCIHGFFNLYLYNCICIPIRARRVAMDSFPQVPSGGWPIQDERVRRIPRKQAKLSMARSGGLLVFQGASAEVSDSLGQCSQFHEFNEGLPYFSTTCTLSGENYHLLQSKPTLPQGFLNRWADRVAIYRLQQSGGGAVKEKQKEHTKR